MASIASKAGEVLMPCAETFDETLAFFTTRLGFVVQRIYPADAPRLAAISGHGLTLRLDGTRAGPKPTVVLRVDAPVGPSLTAPNGAVVEFEPMLRPVSSPPLASSLVVTRSGDDHWITGRAGMRYRDLIPDRQGGRFIASHIRIDEGGPVPDYVHFHRVFFQFIFVRRGWVRVVYEDQGEPFVMRAGDCVLQPPEIRHRVLESSAGLEVIEVGCPAEHETHADPGLELPTDRIDRDRAFDGQRFVCHAAQDAPWVPWGLPNFEAQVFGLGPASAGRVEAGVVRPAGAENVALAHDDELLLLHVLAGQLSLPTLGIDVLKPDDSCVVPAGTHASLARCSDDLRMLLVRVPS